MTPAQDAPVRKSVGLRFGLGDKVFFTRSYPGLVYKTPYFAQSPIGEDADVLRQLEDRSLDAVLVRYAPTDEGIARISRRAGLIEYVPETYRRYVIALSGSFEEYFKGLSSNTRSSIKRKVKKVAERAGGQCRFEIFTAPAEMERFHALASAISDRTYQKNLLGIRLPAASALVESAQRDAVIGFILHHDDRPAAYLLCPIEGDVIRYEYVGYDPELAEWSVGLVTQYLAIQKAFEMKRFRLWDFGQGEGQHKQVFANNAQLCADRYYLRPTLANRFVVRLHVVAKDLNDRLRALAERLDIKAKLKRGLRRAHGV